MLVNNSKEKRLEGIKSRCRNLWLGHFGQTINSSLDTPSINRAEAAVRAADAYAEKMFYIYCNDSNIAVDTYEDKELDVLRENNLNGHTKELQEVRDKWTRIKKERALEGQKAKLLKAIRTLRGNEELLREIGWEVEFTKIEEDTEDD
jgi:hypothetical protein